MDGYVLNNILSDCSFTNILTDSNNDVAGYAYFMVSNGMLMSGNGMSPYGSTYATYSS